MNAINATSVLASWEPPLQEDQNGIIQRYTLRVVGVHTDEDIIISTNSTRTEISVDNLHPFYSYKFTVAAVTISHGPFGQPVTVVMPPLGKLSMPKHFTSKPHPLTWLAGSKHGTVMIEL